MANLGDISPSIIKRVSTVLEGKLESLTSYKVEVGGPRAVAEVLNRLGQKASKATIEYIEDIDDKLATTIKELMFTFEDINTLNQAAIREILKNVDKKDLMIALKGSGDALKEKFLSSMSQRASDSFKEEMQFLGAVRVKDVEDTGYPGESFDLICAFQTHFHWRYLENSLRELRRLMTDDGVLIIACEQRKISFFLPRLEQDDDLCSWLMAMDLNLTQTVRRAGWVAYLIEKFPRQTAPAAEKVSRELCLPARGFPDSSLR